MYVICSPYNCVQMRVVLAAARIHIRIVSKTVHVYEVVPATVYIYE
jgi:hypothetical protein